MGHQAPLTLFVLGALACSDTPASLPPYGQVVLSVDTDLPAPAIAGRLRLDLYAQDGTWFESRDLAVPDPSAWPLSFGLWSDDETSDKLSLARVRIYPEGRLRDYAGPPLVSATGEVTPAQEPLPELTVDRLVLVHVRPNVVTYAAVVLHGACVGVAPQLGSLTTSTSCTDTRGALAAVTEPADSVGPSLINTFGAGPPCPETTNAAYVCVPAGAFIFGGLRFANLDVESSAPERVAVMSKFAIDRTEVTVAQYRDALAHGLPRGGLFSTNFVAATGSACVYTFAPGPRENAPLNCVYWASARAYCRMHGGDLPSEAQWERAATTSVPGALKPRFPWGDDVPDCARSSWGRAYDADAGVPYPPYSQDCKPLPLGPPQSPSTTDVSQLGILDMGGSMAEWTLDDARAFLDTTWTQAPLIDPVIGPSAMYTIRSARGGSWRGDANNLDTLRRDFELEDQANLDYVGFRCVYTTPPGGWW